MASIISGYEYDIFISYRQKDNKGDRWVSEFVEVLKTELESTFKEEVSVYFDINPHDGLLETHDVDASLKEKLKCLIFIPIISRTYCDPKSFAWEHEFNAFIEQASKDQFGLKIKLPNGNVANRVLPIRIHDLDNEDIKLCESVLGGVLRGIELIYKEPGVNRPLKSDDDDKINLNKTKYRNQINKVANAIKEIITGIGQYIPQEAEVSKEILTPKIIPWKNRKIKIIAGLIIALALIVLGYFLVPKLIASNNTVEKSIAVLPFINDSPNDSTTYFINGIMEEILNNLQKIKDFRVLSRTSTEQYRGSNKPAIPKIAKELDVNYIVEGSGQKYGNTFRLRVQLIAAHNEKHLWAESFEQEIRETKDIFKIQSRIAQSIAGELKATITPEEKQLIDKIPTTNLTAYDFYHKAEEVDMGQWPEFNPEAARRKEVLLHKALKCDSSYAQAYAALAGIIWIKIDRDSSITDSNIFNKYLDSMLVLTNIALSYDEKLAEAYRMRGVYYDYKGSSKKSEEEYDKVLRINPNDGGIYLIKALTYQNINLVKTLENGLKAASLSHGSELLNNLRMCAYFYYQAGFAEKGNDFLLEAFKLDGDSAKYSGYVAYYGAIYLGDYKGAIEYYEKGYLRDTTDAGALDLLGEYYLRLGRYQESLKYYKKYISLLISGGQTKPPLESYIGYSYLQNGYRKEADFYFDKTMEGFSNPLFRSRHAYMEVMWEYFLAGIYACRGDKGKAYENLKLFDKAQTVALDWVISIKNDPLFNSIRNEPEFQKIVRNMEARYQAEHERVRKWLEEQGKL
jgi:TolB-like protein/Tfp pilus assembly protein PilF